MKSKRTLYHIKDKKTRRYVRTEEGIVAVFEYPQQAIKYIVRRLAGSRRYTPESFKRKKTEKELSRENAREPKEVRQEKKKGTLKKIPK